MKRDRERGDIIETRLMVVAEMLDKAVLELERVMAVLKASDPKVTGVDDARS